MDLRQIDWQTYGLTVLNPLTFILTIIMGITVLIVKREYVIIPFIIIACFVTNMQRLVIFDMDFPMLRIMVAFGIIRLMIKKEQRSFKLNTIDKLIICWVVSRTITHALLWRSIGAIMEPAGFLIDSMGVYFIARIFLYDLNDYNIIIKAFAVCSIVVAVFMLYEQMTGRNFFSVLGGVPEYTLVREGKLRSQGAFSHAIMAGTFGASLIPLMWALWINNYKFYAITGIIGGFLMTMTCSSSGPVLTLLAGIGGLFLWKFRDYIKRIKQGGILMLIGLHLVMKGPVWSLLTRIDISGGSTGYHRANLIDAAVRHFKEWMLLGTRYPGAWGWGLQDLTNMFVFEAVNGGIIPLILFILSIRYCFKSIGSARIAVKDNPNVHKYIWALGSVLFAHVISFIGVAYFGQMIFFYFLEIAMISSLINLPTITDLTKSESV